MRERNTTLLFFLIIWLNGKAEIYFSVIKHANKKLESFNKLENDVNYFVLGHSGFCEISEIRGKDITYKSIFGQYHTTKSKLKNMTT